MAETKPKKISRLDSGFKTEELKSWKDFSEIAQDTAYSNYIFRGVSNYRDKLIPKVGRDDFRKNIKSFPTLQEGILLERFRRVTPPHLEFKPGNLLEWLTVAQHHGVPTRLLDWTESPFIAAYFAVRSGQPEKQKTKTLRIISGNRLKETGGTSEFVFPASIYGIPAPREFHPRLADEIFRKVHSKKVYLYRPPHISPRITVQRAVLTIHGTPHEEFIPEKGGIIWSIRGEDMFINFKKALNVVGINEASLFPDLDGIGRHLGWLASQGL